MRREQPPAPVWHEVISGIISIACLRLLRGDSGAPSRDRVSVRSSDWIKTRDVGVKDLLHTHSQMDKNPHLVYILDNIG